MIAGVFKPTEGKVIKNGRLVPLLELGAGFDPQYTGRENIYLYGAVLGFSKKFLDEKLDEIIEFSELGKFIDVPVKNYSSGMKSRLGFSINLCLDPDIMIVDEALSVGDKGFAEKCLNKMTELKEQGKTIIFISHNLRQVRSFCDSAMWIEGGMLREYGDIDEVCDHYADYVEYYNHLSAKEKRKVRDEKFAKRVIPNSHRTLGDKLFAAIKTR